MDLRQIAADIPDYQSFLTVDQLNASSHRLAERYPDIASIKQVGETRRGDPIELLTINGGGPNAFVFGGPPSQRTHRLHDSGIPGSAAL